MLKRLDAEGADMEPELADLVAERRAILDRISAADVTFDYRRPDETGPTPGSIREELRAFDDAHPEVAAEMKRLRKLAWR